MVKYRVGIDRKTETDLHGWYSDYATEPETVKALAKDLEIDLGKFRVYEADHGSARRPQDRLVPAEMREQIVRKALRLLSDPAAWWSLAGASARVTSIRPACGGAHY